MFSADLAQSVSLPPWRSSMST